MKISLLRDIQSFLRKKLSSNITYNDDINIYEKQYKFVYLRI